MSKNGATDEEIARNVVEMRNNDKIKVRAKMLPEELEPLEKRNMKKYGNPVGPDAEWLFNNKKDDFIEKGTYKSDNQVWKLLIESSTKKDKVINTLLGIDR